MENSAFIRVPPGGGQHTYTYTIPVDHPTGLFWYHDPTHGSTMLHVMGGLYGALYVDLPNPALQLPPPLNSISIDLMVLSHVSVWTEVVAATSPRPPLNYIKFQELCGDALNANPVYKDPAITDHYLVNQAFQPWVVISTGELRRFDLVHAAGSQYHLEIELRTSIAGGDIATRCQLFLIALDGIYLSVPRQIAFLPLLAGQRASVLVTCSKAGIYFLQSHPDNTTRPVSTFGPDYVRYGQNLVTVVVSGKATNSPPLPDLSRIPRADYLTNLAGLTPAQVNHWEMSTDQKGSPPYITWLGVGVNCSSKYAPADAGTATAADANLVDPQCKFQPFAGAQGVPDGSYRHTAAGGGGDRRSRDSWALADVRRDPFPEWALSDHWVPALSRCVRCLFQLVG